MLKLFAFMIMTVSLASHAEDIDFKQKYSCKVTNKTFTIKDGVIEEDSKVDEVKETSIDFAVLDDHILMFDDLYDDDHYLLPNPEKCMEWYELELMSLAMESHAYGFDSPFCNGKSIGGKYNTSNHGQFTSHVTITAVKTEKGLEAKIHDVFVDIGYLESKSLTYKCEAKKPL